MEENNNKQVDAFLKKQLQEIPLESPSIDFTNHIMSVLDKESSKSTQYVPLISKKVWFAIVAVIVALFFIPFQKQEDSILDKVPIDFSFLDKVNLSGVFEGFSISSATFYAMLLFSIMIFVQIFYIKGYFSKRESGL
ncbi:hypothetical protein AAON49_10955 [Pseudotenacibaculum sp. MALMAid0570]|uniref:hypothetical protein n=1 Tax=Pseudotenacibaculum sp. MALMAid0570 TaxID=3143938 RepID=UPI0032DFDFF1